MPTTNMTGAKQDGSIGLMSLFWLFLGIGCTSFGGYMAMISAAQATAVTRRRLLRDEDVLDGLSLATALPGPTAVNVVAFLGYRLQGLRGAAIAACAAVVPAFLVMIVLAEAYLLWGDIPGASRAFMGVTPAVTALIVAAGVRMCRSTLGTACEYVIAFAALVTTLAFPGIATTVAVIASAALAGRLLLAEKPGSSVVRVSSSLHPVARVNARLLLFAAFPLLLGPLPDFSPDSLLSLGSTFAGMGMLMFGGGYTFVPIFQQTVVDHYGWVTQREFVDALALGQLTPGPIMISATFIGYKVAGLGGAIAATAGMFVPPAVFMIICTRMLDGAVHLHNARGATRGVRSAAAGMVCAAGVLVGSSAALHWLSIALFCLSLFALMRFCIGAAWVVFAAAAAGFFFYQG